MPSHGGEIVMVLAHGTGFCGAVWGPVVARMSRAVEVVAPDLRAHGSTPRPVDDVDLAWDGFAEDVLAAVEGAGWGPRLPVVAAGHSKGATALLLAEQRRPGTFAALWCHEPIIVPVDPPVGPLGDDFPMVGQALRRRESFPDRATARAQFAAKAPMASFHPEVLDAYVAHGLVDRADGTVALACSPTDEAQIYRMQTAHGAFGGLRRVTCPVVVSSGADTDAIPPSVAVKLAAALPNGTVEVTPGWNHFAPLCDLVGMARRLDRLVASLR